MSNIDKYLDRYCEESVRDSDIKPVTSFDSVLVIPVYNESWEAIQKFLNYSSNKCFALVLVFNVPDLDDPSEDQLAAQNSTHISLSKLRETLEIKRASGYEYSLLNAGNSLYVIDRTVNKINPKQGVGLARKLGLDFALTLCELQKQHTGKSVEWIHSSDADVNLPDSYFDIEREAMLGSNLSALIYPFVHKPDLGYELPMSLYEFSLRHYVESLSLAGSPYAFHTIGSLIVVNNECYATVRGIPKRSAGEDFYLLNKLAKVGQVYSLEAPQIIVAGRPSTRVPFGTGPALNKIKKMNDPSQEYSFYNPRSFELLGGLLAIIANAEHGFASADRLFSELYSKMSEADAKNVIAALKELKIVKQFEHLSIKRSGGEFKKAFHVWFDAFVTLRFIHILRDSGYENVRFGDLEAKFKASYRALV